MPANGFREAATLMEGEAGGQIVTNTKGGGGGCARLGAEPPQVQATDPACSRGPPGRRELDQEASFL